MQMMKKEAGITMMILVITIIILGILGAVLISYSVVGTKQSRDKKYLTNLEIVQHAVYERGEQYKITNDESLLVGNIASKPAENIQWAEDNAYWSKSNAYEKYYKIGKTEAKALGIENADDTEYIINYKTQEVYDMTHKQTSTGKALYNMSK